MKGPCAVSGTIWNCDFTRSGGYLAEAIWDTSESCHKGGCSTRSHTVSPQYVNYLTLDGNKVNITNGTVPIGAKPIWLQNQ